MPSAMAGNPIRPARQGAKPWYREPWPWILIAIPAVSIVLGVIMLVLAMRTHDGLVVDDYYKQGLAINQTLDREKRAQALDLTAELTFTPDRRRIYLRLKAPADALRAPMLSLVHPTRAGEDQHPSLIRTPAGEYEAEIGPLAAGRWRIVLEDKGGGWRLAGVWHTEESTLMLAGAKQDTK